MCDLRDFLHRKARHVGANLVFAPLWANTRFAPTYGSRRGLPSFARRSGAGEPGTRALCRIHSTSEPLVATTPKNRGEPCSPHFSPSGPAPTERQDFAGGVSRRKAGFNRVSPDGAAETPCPFAPSGLCPLSPTIRRLTPPASAPASVVVRGVQVPSRHTRSGLKPTATASP